MRVICLRRQARPRGETACVVPCPACPALVVVKTSPEHRSRGGDLARIEAFRGLLKASSMSRRRSSSLSVFHPYQRTCENYLGETMFEDARKHWKPATPLMETRGRTPNRAKHVCSISHQQRAFAAGIIHSCRIYNDRLGPHEPEIRAMLLARGMITRPLAKLQSLPNTCGVRPTERDLDDANAWLDENVYVASMGKSRQFDKGLYRLCIDRGTVSIEHDKQTFGAVFPISLQFPCPRGCVGFCKADRPGCLLPISCQIHVITQGQGQIHVITQGQG